ncbi:MAG: hypothetical protein EBV53_13355, partial [Proteobacteria bacterium]|nr:hypothetical protein [Pseudomonadota bacterium]
RIEAANDSFTTNPAFTPVQYLSQVVSTDTYLRPAVEAAGGTRAMMNSGMVISIPKITTNSTVASTAEAGTPSNTGIVSSYITGNVTKYAGQQTYSVEIGERSDPAFFDVMMSNLSKAYAKATDAAVIAALTAGGTQATAVAATSDGIISYVATESPATYRAMGNSPCCREKAGYPAPNHQQVNPWCEGLMTMPDCHRRPSGRNGLRCVPPGSPGNFGSGVGIRA